MKKLLISLLASLLLAITAMPPGALAQIDPQYLREVLTEDNGWPLSTLCTGTDVRVRAEANTNCDIITYLQPGDVFYVKEVITMADYDWCKGVTAQGERGFVAINYLQLAHDAATQNGRFKAAFETDRIFDGETLAQEIDITFQYDPSKVIALEEEIFHYAPYKYQVGNNWIHGDMLSNGEFIPIGVLITGPGHKVAGLEVGQKLTDEEFDLFKKNMNLIGWEGPHSYNDEHYWYLYNTVDSQERPVRGFDVILQDNIIKEIRYYYIPID